MQNAEQPIQAIFNLDNAATLRLLWPILPQEKKDELIAAEIVTIAIVAPINANVDWRVYDGKLAVWSYYRAYGEKIADFMPMQTVELNALEAQEMALFLMSRNPRIQAAVVAAYGGVMPPILPPINLPEPVVEPTLDAGE